MKSLRFLVGSLMLILASSMTSESFAQSLSTSLSGSVFTFDEQGQRVPLIWANINAFNESYNMTTYTDGYGSYHFLLPFGTYNLTAAFRGYETQSRNVTLSPRQVLYINFYLKPQQMYSGYTDSLPVGHLFLAALQHERDE